MFCQRPTKQFGERVQRGRVSQHEKAESVDWRGVACTSIALLTRTRLVRGGGWVEPTAPRPARQSLGEVGRGAPRIGRRFSAGTQKQKGIPHPGGHPEGRVKRRKLLFTRKTAKLGRFSQQNWLLGSFSGPTAHPDPPGRGRLGIVH
jgi:hypothetical protein